MYQILIAGIPSMTVNYQDALSRLNAVPAVSLDPGMAVRCDALLLPGGGDIDPSLFGEAANGSYSINPVLDRRQLYILDRFVRLGKPVLGICKGLQVINVYFRGSIIQDLPTADAHRHNGQDQVHSTRALPGSILAGLYGEEFAVNSAHHQGIGRVGHGLSVIQDAPDGVAEGVVHSRLPILGVQWHPERMCFSRARSDTVDGSLLLARFLDLCRPDASLWSGL